MSRTVAPWTLVFVFMAISLAAVVSVLFIVLGGSEPVWGSLTPADFEPRPVTRAERLRQRLNIQVNLDKGIDPNTPLKDAIEFLADRYDLPMLIDSKAFETIGVQKVEEQPVQLPKMVGVSMRTVLRLLMAQIKGDVYHGTYIVQGDCVILTTTAHVYQGEQWSLELSLPPPTVDVDANQKPFSTVVQDIVDASGVNVLIDPKVGDKARRQISVTLGHVPVDTAVRLVSDMVGLRLVIIDNVLYVTTPENAKDLQAEQKARLAAKRATGAEPAEPAGSNPFSARPE
jgi:hypothetical protein